MKPNAIFLTNETYIDKNQNEGGASLCTKEFLELISLNYNVIQFTVKNRKSFLYKLQVKMGLNTYGDFNFKKYTISLSNLIKKTKSDTLFLNQANTSCFGHNMKSIFGESLKVYLCSHGNESGDLLHDSTRFKNNTPLNKRLFLNFNLGRTIRKEVFYRLNVIDGVLTVSETEFQIENWLGAKKVILIPRTITNSFLNYDKSLGVIGFVGDLSHPPNYDGLYKVCKEIKKLNKQLSLELRIVSSSNLIGVKLQNEFQFIRYLGYLSNTDLVKECKSWSFFINPVFYFSRGVTTKLAKSLSLGIPVITTPIGNRGYKWSNGTLPTVNTPFEMASLITQLPFDIEKINYFRLEVQKIYSSTLNIDELAKELENFTN